MVATNAVIKTQTIWMNERRILVQISTKKHVHRAFQWMATTLRLWNSCKTTNLALLILFTKCINCRTQLQTFTMLHGQLYIARINVLIHKGANYEPTCADNHSRLHSVGTIPSWRYGYVAGQPPEQFHSWNPCRKPQIVACDEGDTYSTTTGQFISRDKWKLFIFCLRARSRNKVRLCL